jgi:mannose-6-phosphate isomerase-like protein (cupin superfamily)
MLRWTLVMAVVAAGCAEANAPVTATPAAAVDPAPASNGSRVEAHFLEGRHEHVAPGPCDTVFVAGARGHTGALGETLDEGDVLTASGVAAFDVQTSDLALVATVRAACGANGRPAIQKSVVRSNDRPELVWAGGQMKARLVFEGAPVYFGRLEGTAPVAEHAHPTSWEILCAVEGAGVFTVEGKAARLGPHAVVALAPTVKHSWQPDAGTKLVAFQIYDPPGPEQRFKSLAAAAAGDAGRAAR